MIVDYVGRYENLAQDFQYVLRKLEVDATINLPHLNMSHHNEYRRYYTDETREDVRRWASRDIEMFGYEMFGYEF